MEVPIFSNVKEEQFREEVAAKRIPVVIRGADVGSCVAKWTPEYLERKLGSKEVKVHESVEARLDFVQKNFKYVTMRFGDLMKEAVASRRYYYLRSLGADPRGRDVAQFESQYPEIADDLKIPCFYPSDSKFSSVFRAGSANVQLWTHYDVMDNVLIQVTGRKRVVLFSPDDALNLYLNGDKSEVKDIDNPDLEKFPRFSQVKRFECRLEPGDILFIPALWFHNVTCLEFGVAVNVFWRHLDASMYDKKDSYGNKDLVPASLALATLDRALKQLELLPDDYKKFYARRMISRIEHRMGINTCDA